MSDSSAHDDGERPQMESSQLERPAPARPAASPITIRELPNGKGAALGRPVCRVLLRMGWRVRVYGTEHLPAHGPVILAGNHTGVFDGPLLFGTSPRPAHVVTKEEVFVGPVGPLLRGVGQIPINRRIIDFPAILTALRVLSNEGVLGLYPEGERGAGDFSKIRDGLAYMALRTGAPVVPVANFGVVRPGKNSSMPPPFRARVDVVYGEPFHVEPAEPWGPYLPRQLVTEARDRIRTRLLAHLVHACELTGNPAPANVHVSQARHAQPSPRYDHDPASD